MFLVWTTGWTDSIVVVVQLLNCVQFCDPRDCSMPSFPVLCYSQSLLKFMSIESVMVSNHLILCLPLLLFPSIFPSIRVFSSELFFPSVGQSIGALALASVLPMNIRGWFPWGLTGLISLQCKRLSSLFQHHSLKASVFFMVQLSHLYGPYLTTGKTIIWLCGPLSAKWCLCILLFFLGFSEFFSQEANAF